MLGVGLAFEPGAVEPDAGRLIAAESRSIPPQTTIAAPDTRFGKYIIVDEDTLKQKPYAEGGKKQRALHNRDILRLFDGLKVSESFLLKTNIREFLFRKP